MHVPTLVAALAIVVVATAIFGYIAQRIGLVAMSPVLSSDPMPWVLLSTTLSLWKRWVRSASYF